MSALWYKEWREFAPSLQALAVRLLTPLLLLAPLLQVDWLRLPALAAALSLLGASGTAGQVARERSSGFLPRLALAPVSPHTLVLQRVLSRSLLVLLQVLPLLLLAPDLAAPAVPVAIAACAGGALLGLRAPSRRQARVWGIAAAIISSLGFWSFGSRADGTLPCWITALALTGAALWAAPAALLTQPD